ncbi:MAG: hypothetical protein ACRCS9_14335 [Hyphomicrobium sp.]
MTRLALDTSGVFSDHRDVSVRDRAIAAETAAIVTGSIHHAVAPGSEGHVYRLPILAAEPRPSATIMPPALAMPASPIVAHDTLSPSRPALAVDARVGALIFAGAAEAPAAGRGPTRSNAGPRMAPGEPGAPMNSGGAGDAGEPDAIELFIEEESQSRAVTEHPLVVANPDSFVVVCLAACRPSSDKVVFRVSKAAAAAVAAANVASAKGRFEPTANADAAHAANHGTERSQKSATVAIGGNAIVATDAVCIAGCYRDDPAPRRVTAIIRRQAIAQIVPKTPMTAPAASESRPAPLAILAPLRVASTGTAKADVKMANHVTARKRSGVLAAHVTQRLAVQRVAAAHLISAETRRYQSRKARHAGERWVTTASRTDAVANWRTTVRPAVVQSGNVKSADVRRRLLSRHAHAPQSFAANAARPVDLVRNRLKARLIAQPRSLQSPVRIASDLPH